MLTPIFKLEITEDYDDLPLLRQKDEYLMIGIVGGGFRNADLKALNFIRKFLQAVTLANISTADGIRISIQAYDVIVGNGLRTGILRSGLRHQLRKKCQHILLSYGNLLSTSVSLITVLI